MTPDQVFADPDALAQALRNAVTGIPTTEAAVRLIIANGHWLRRDAFQARVTLVGGTAEDPAYYADVAWSALHRLAASRTGLPDTTAEITVLRVACLLADGWLGDGLASCDARNVGLIVDAVRHAGGVR